MSKYVKFIKEHSAGIKEGTITKLDQKRFDKFSEQGYVKEITEKEFEEHKKKNQSDNLKRSKKLVKDADSKAKAKAKRLADQKKITGDVMTSTPGEDTGPEDEGNDEDSKENTEGSEEKKNDQDSDSESNTEDNTES